MRHKRLINFLVFISLAILPLAEMRAQTPANKDIGQMVNNAEAATKVYIESFKNLLADETKIFETYDKDGSIKKLTTIESNFLVYQLSGPGNKVVEFRNVFSVDGKILDDTEKRITQLFEKVAESESSDKEKKRIRDESLRYDDRLKIYGMTLYEGAELDSGLRDFFDFKFEGSREVDNRTVNVISFHQNKPCPYIAVNTKLHDTAGHLTQAYYVPIDKNVALNDRLQGEIWIDVATNQLWREIRQVTIQPEGFAAREIVITADFRFQTSEIGIFPPKMIQYTQNRVRVKDRTITNDVRVTFKYSNFTKSDVVVKSSEIKTKP